MTSTVVHAVNNGGVVITSHVKEDIYVTSMVVHAVGNGGVVIPSEVT